MNLGFPELLVILLFAFLIVGPDKLPQLGKTIGKAVRRFRDAQDKVNESLAKEGLDPESIREASANPFLALEKVGQITDKIQDVAGEQKEPEDGPAGEAGAESAAAAVSEPEAGPQAAAPAPRKVISLSDRESFTERKMRLANARPSAQEPAAEGPAEAAPAEASVDASDGGEQPGA